MGARILIIDDSPTVSFVIARALKPKYDVDSIAGVDGLMECLQAKPPDLILLDLELPSVDGEAFAHFVRRNQTRPTAILIHSSRPEDELQAAADAINAEGIVRKGCDPEALQQLIAQTLAYFKVTQ